MWALLVLVIMAIGAGPALGDTTDRPIIGILAQDVFPPGSLGTLNSSSPNGIMPASIVKFIEGAGARVAPILLGQTAAYYSEIVQSVNGILLPGVATARLDSVSIYPINATTSSVYPGYVAAAKLVYDEAVRINRAGKHLPVLGICLGMQMIAALEAGADMAENDIRVPCQSQAQRLPLELLPDAGSSQLFSQLGASDNKTLRTENVTVNEHGYCLTQDVFARYSLKTAWKSLAVNNDKNGLEFISAFESKNMPIFGLQFHPEKVIYEWNEEKAYPHTASAISACRYFADIFIFESRKNSQAFSSNERGRLIYNYEAIDTGQNLPIEQMYLFGQSVDISEESNASASLSPLHHRSALIMAAFVKLFRAIL